MYVKVKGQWMYHYRAVVRRKYNWFLLSKTRDHKAATDKVYRIYKFPIYINNKGAGEKVMIRKLIMIGIGGTFIGVGINLFLLPSHLINGGIFGISLLLKYLWGFKLGITIVCLNMPIYLVALKHNPSYFYNSLFGLLATSLMIDLLFPLNGIIHLPTILSAILGGLIIGIGVGIMLRYNTCPGGIDLLAFWFLNGLLLM